MLRYNNIMIIGIGSSQEKKKAALEDMLELVLQCPPLPERCL
jgi:hypothetical protein